MRIVILASGIVLALVHVSLAMPAAPLPVLSNAVQVHGCHHNYGHDISVGTDMTRNVGRQQEPNPGEKLNPSEGRLSWRPRHLREIQYRRGQDQNAKEGEHDDDCLGIVVPKRRQSMI